MKKFGLLPALLAVCATVGCSDGKVKLETVDKSYFTDTVYAEVKIPRISGLSSESLSEAVNEGYEKTVTELFSSFTESAKNSGAQSRFETNTIVHLNQNGFFSAVTQIDSTIFGSTKNSVRISENIDTVKCTEVKLSELFEDDEYIDMLNSRIDEEIKKNPDKYRELWEKPAVSPNQRYFVNDSNLVLFYPPYELSYYERGFVEIPLPLADMSGYLKSDYRKLAGE